MSARMMQGDCPKGYKQTEVGVIPEDWSVIDYVSFGQVIDGDRGFHYPGAGELSDNGHYLFLNAGNVTKAGFRFGECQFISAEKDKKLNKGKLTRGDVVLTTRGTIGNFAYYGDDITFESIRINSGMVILRNLSPMISNAYQYLVLRSHVVDSQIERLSFGSAQPQLTVKGISTLKFPLPPTKAEQEAIAEALSDADALIESLEQLIAKKRQVKQGAMQELLTGKRRLPGFDVGATGRSPLRDVPHGWEVKRLGDLCTMKSGEGITAKSIDDVSPFPCFGGNGLRGFTTRFTHEGNHCLIGRVGALCGNLLKVTGRFFASEHAIVVTALENVDINWLTLALGMLELNRRAESSAQPVLTVSKLQPLEILVPTAKTEQTAIAAILSDMDTEIAELEAKLAKARQVKQGMMQELLTGRIRLV